jgi:hypothetical protein
VKEYSARLLAALFYGLPMSDQVKDKRVLTGRRFAIRSLLAKELITDQMAVTDKGVAELVKHSSR